jgi:putative hydrolase of the HAD superfamily
VPITTVFFDLDDTVYPATSGLWNAIRERISLYMHECLGIPWEDIPDLRRKYFEEYGTALRGLEANYPVRQEDYLAYVHDLPLQDYLQPNPNLRFALERLQTRKLIFTNADSAHARRVLTVLEVFHLFDGIVDINDLEPFCKPMPESFQRAMLRADEKEPGRCALIDDMLRNTAGAHDFGMRTVLFGTDQPHPSADATLTNWLDLPKVLEKLETSQ